MVHWNLALNSSVNCYVDQVYVYVYKHVKLMDTIEIDSPIEHRLKKYCLDSYKSVLEFWFDLQFTAINTPLRKLYNLQKITTTKNSRIYVVEIGLNG